MKLVHIALIFLSSIFTVIALDADQLKPLLDTAIDAVMSSKNLPFPDLTIQVTENQIKIGTGNLDLTDIYLFEFDTLQKNLVEVIQLPADEGFTKNNINIQLAFDDLGIHTNYNLNAAVGISEIPFNVPLYGNGEFSIGLKDVTLDISVNFIDQNIRNASISDLSIKLRFGPDPDKTFITGFWKSDLVDEVITKGMDAGMSLMSLVYFHNVECTDCIISRTLEFLVNYSLKVENLQPNIECSCFQDFPFDFRSLLELSLQYGIYLSTTVTN